MAIPQPLEVKFLRYFDVPSFSDNGSMFGIWLRIIYEFWGFCVNGTNDLKHPGGFPTGSAANIHMTGVINMPNGWESGSNILIYSNSDGITNDGMPYFTGSNFTSAMVGKWLTVWKSGSASHDDSIYLITKLYGPTGTTTSSVIGVDNNMGGTPYPGNLKPAFTARTNINYRVIDYAPINQSHTTQNFIVLQMNGAPYVNQGQANSQVKLRLATFRGDTFPRGIAILCAGSGSWGVSGSSVGFTETLLGGNSLGGGNNGASVASNIGEVGPNSGNSFDWHNGGGGTQCINLIAAQDFLTFFSRGGHATYSTNFHVEIPQRIYPIAYDPNPMCLMGSTGIYTTFTDGYGYGFGFYMYSTDNKPYKHWLAIHHQSGDFYNTTIQSSLQGVGPSYYNHMWFNPLTNKFVFSDAILGTNQPAPGHYMARARLRRVRFITPIIPSMQRLGDNGEWLHTFNGVLWPWDNALMPATIFHQGG